ncbi:hypothetical protein GY45DRAFT_1004776 [Cubamyces sp. BRFM 1775]|nr:hypothetical protein GY45DRAFT_1004776 [Cubamyces sp. BRFM 1775]
MALRRAVPLLAVSCGVPTVPVRCGRVRGRSVTAAASRGELNAVSPSRSTRRGTEMARAAKASPVRHWNISGRGRRQVPLLQQVQQSLMVCDPSERASEKDITMPLHRLNTECSDMSCAKVIPLRHYPCDATVRAIRDQPDAWRFREIPFEGHVRPSILLILESPAEALY